MKNLMFTQVKVSIGKVTKNNDSPYRSYISEVKCTNILPRRNGVGRVKKGGVGVKGRWEQDTVKILPDLFRHTKITFGVLHESIFMLCTYFMFLFVAIGSGMIVLSKTR